MPIHHKIIKNQFPDMQASIAELNGTKINVGCLEGEHAWLASIHEYGCKIPVTDKMRAFLHYQGIHLKPSTTMIIIPERAFLRGGFDEYAEDVIDSAEPLMADVIGGTMSVDQLSELIGLMLSSKIKEFAVDLKSPPNSSMTIERKGSSNPLVDTGDMIGSITYEVTK